MSETEHDCQYCAATLAVYSGDQWICNTTQANAKLIVASVNNAGKLAEALRVVFTQYKRGICEIDASVCIQARAALAAWEAAQ